MSKTELIDLNGDILLTGSSRSMVMFENVGGKWDTFFQAWRFPAIYASVDEVLTHYPDVVISSPLVKEMIAYPNGFEINEKAHKTYDVSVRKQFDKLYTYQKLAVYSLTQHPYKRMLLAFSPGLGKTPTSIVAAQVVRANRVLVICPLILVRSWKKEVERWSNYTAEVTHGVVPNGTVNVNITNYETIVKHVREYKKEKWDVVIIDESIRIKNYRQNSKVTSQRAMAVGEVAKKVEYVWELSGGPISNHAGDLFGQFRVMYPTIFKSYWKFVDPICVIERSTFSTSGRYGGKVVATKPNVNIKKRFKDIYFVRSMEEVAPEIPDYIYQDVPLEMGSVQAASYNEARLDVLKHIEQDEVIDIIFNKLTSMIRLQQAVSNPACFGGDDVSIKRDFIVQSIQDNSYEFPMLIFAHWRYTVINLHKVLQETFPNLRVGAILGGQGSLAQEVAEEFEKGNIDILVLSIQAGKYGLNFPLTKTVVMHDRIWDADAMFQATFRARRRTTKHSPVWVSLYIPETIDDYIRDILEVKLKSIQKVTGTDILEILGKEV